MAEISQSYFNFDLPYLNSFALEELGRLASQIARETAQEVFRLDTSIEVVLEPGSLKGWITAAGIVLGGIATYSDLKSSVKELYADSRWFAEKVGERFIQQSGAKEEEVRRVERRTKAIGRLHRLIYKLEQVQRKVEMDHEMPTADTLEELQHHFDLAMGALSEQERDLLLKSLSAPGGPLDKSSPLGKVAILPTDPNRTRRRDQVLSLEVKGGEYLGNPHRFQALPGHYSLAGAPTALQTVGILEVPRSGKKIFRAKFPVPKSWTGQQR